MHVPSVQIPSVAPKFRSRPAAHPTKRREASHYGNELVGDVRNHALDCSSVQCLLGRMVGEQLGRVGGRGGWAKGGFEMRSR